MSKPRKIGLKTVYIPNSKADMRHHKKVYQRGREKAFQNVPEQWIPVTERLPEKEGDYLIYVTVPFTGSKFITVMHYEKDAYIPIWLDTTHWMPLPQPPKGE